MDTKVIFYPSALKQVDAKFILALEKTAEAIHTDLVQSQTMPFEYGTLQNESTFVQAVTNSDSEFEIISSTPYARRLYYHPEYNFSTDENPNAGGKWFEPYLNGSKQDWMEKKFSQFYK